MRSKLPRIVAPNARLASRRDVLQYGGFALGATILAPRWALAQSVTTFDYYISTTGSDGNPGTLAAPWAITAINSKRSTYAGKRLGIIAGTYDMLAAAGGSYPGSYDQGFYQIQGGSAGSPTYIGSCDANGSYSPLLAKLNGNQTAANTPGSQPLMGGLTTTPQSYITVDGIEFYNILERALDFGATQYPNGPRLNNIIVQNCHFHTMRSVSGGGNPAFMTFWDCTNSIMQNNYFTDYTNTAGRQGAAHMWNCRGCKFLYNTIVGTGGTGFQIKSGYSSSDQQYDNEVGYNYIDFSAASGMSGNGAMAWDLHAPDSTHVSSYHHNIILSANGGQSYIGQPEYSSPDTQKHYNNTFIGCTGNGYMALGAGPVYHYNNIYDAASTGVAFACNAQQPALWDYNLYGQYAPGITANNSYGSSNTTVYSTQASFAAGVQGSCDGKDAHARTGRPTYLGGGHGNALDYKLASGSLGKGQGSTDGTASGSPCDMGAWGGTDVNTGLPVAQIGCSFAGSFTPQPGFSYVGGNSWDSQFTINSTSSPFGSTGPTLLIHDDFRNGTAGNLMVDGSVPALGGSSVWNQNSPTDLPYWWGGANRSGGNSMRIMNNENPGQSGAPFGRKLKVLFGGEYTAVYYFYAENWNGWDGLNDAGGVGGGYYKHNWITEGDNTAQAFNQVLPDFVAQPNVNTYCQGNDPSFLPNVFLNNPANGHDLWVRTGWNSLECAYVGNNANPTTATGLIYMSLWNATNFQNNNVSNTSNVLFSSTPGTSGSRASCNRVHVVGLIQDTGTITVDRADFYMAVGPQCLSRVFLGDAPTLAACTTINLCTPASWSGSSITVTLRRGAFGATASGTYLYWSDANNNISLVGKFN
jgi:hypothetical protein